MTTPATSQGGEPVTTPTVVPATVVNVSRRETSEFVTRLVGQYGTVDAALTAIAGEQLRYRKRAQAAEKVAVDLQAKVPAAGAVVLVGDEAKAYADLKALGQTLDKVPAMVKEFADLQAKQKVAQRQQDLREAAGTKYDLKVLSKLLADTPIEFQKMLVQKEDKSGVDEVSVPYVVVGTGDRAVRELLDTYLEREHKAFAEVLKLKEGGESEASGGDSTTTVVIPKQSTGNSTPNGKKDATIKMVDAALGTSMTPSQRRKEAAGK